MKILLPIILLSFFFNTYSQQTGIKFEKETSLLKALVKAKATGKLIFIDCYTSWCTPCKKMEKNVFPKKSVGLFYNKNFINLKLDMEKSSGRQVFEKYAIVAFPTLLYLDANGKTIKREAGGYGVNSFIDIGKKAINNAKKLAPLRAKIRRNNPSAETLALYLKIVPEALDREKVLNSYFSSKSKKEKSSNDSWKLFNEFVDDLDNPQFRFFLDNRRSFESQYGEEVIERKIFDAFLKYSNKRRKNNDKVINLKKIDSKLYSNLGKFKEFEKASKNCRKNNKDFEEWNNFIIKTKDYFELNVSPLKTLNDTCWYIYENYKKFSDIKALEMAKKWSKTSLEISPRNHFFNDTYAHILFDLGEIAKAIKYQTKAMHLSPSNFYKEELARFKRAL